MPPPGRDPQPAAAAAAAAAKPVKQRRITRACDYCHHRSIRCSLRPAQDPAGRPSCTNCLQFAQPCTFNRVPKKRGAPPRANRDRPPPPPPPPPPSASSPSSLDRGLSRRSSANLPLPHVASQAVIVDLVDLYFELVYPIFPFFHRPSFRRRISRAEYATDKSLFCVTMAMCALVSSRVRDGAVSNPRWDTASLLMQTSPKQFYLEAWSQLRIDPMRCDLNILRAHALMAIASVQEGATRELHYHIGQYHTLIAMDRLHDESEWPQDINVVEREERRRLFWSIYTLDIYVSLVWGGVVRSREQQFRVSYPLELDDEDIPFHVGDPADDTTASADNQTRLHRDSTSTDGPEPKPSWLFGWNFTTDLYRILEHAMTRFREPRANDNVQTSVLSEIFSHSRAESRVNIQLIRDRVIQLYHGLPPSFKQTPPAMTYDMRKDLYAFQAANIIATVQLLRMVLFSIDESNESSLNDRCQIATEVIDAFMSIPEAYQRAISAPLLHHLGGIGYILGGSASRLGEERSGNEGGAGTAMNLEDGERLYTRLRTVMTAMARLLSKLEGLVTSAHVTEKLGKQIARIDQGIELLQRRKAQREQQQELQRQKSQRIIHESSHKNAGIPSGLSTATILGETSPSVYTQIPPDQVSHASAYHANLQPPPRDVEGGNSGYGVNDLNYVPAGVVDGSEWNLDLTWVPVDVFADFSWALSSA